MDVDSTVTDVSVSVVIDTSVEVLVSDTMSVVVEVATSAVVASTVTVLGVRLRQLHASDILAAGRRLRLGSVRSMQLLAGSMHTRPPQLSVGSGLLTSRFRFLPGIYPAAVVVEVEVTMDSIVEVKLEVAVISVVIVL